MTIFPKIHPKIEKGWKQGMTFGFGINNKEEKTDLHGADVKVKIGYSIPKVSEKKKLRIKEEGSESVMFKEIWDERPHVCEDCGYKLTTPRAHNFDHVIPKSRGKAYRLDKKNIKIVCFGCHYQKSTGQVYKGVNLDLG